MKTLFDQGVPVPLRKALGLHRVETASELGWSKLENGDLFTISILGFSVPQLNLCKFVSLFCRIQNCSE